MSDLAVVHPPIFEMFPAVTLTSSTPVASCACCGVIRPIEILDECICGAYLCGRDGCKSACTCERG